VVEEMVEKGAIPRSYLITKERMEKARRGLTVKEQDERGVPLNGVV
jgi:hypothetical protein